MRVPLAELAEVAKGRKPSQILDAPGPNSIRLIQIADLRQGSDRRYCPLESRTVSASERDVVIAWDGANAGESSWGLAGAVGSTLGVLRLDATRVDTAYLGHYLKFEEPSIRRNTKGATVPHVDPEYLKSLPIPLPQLVEQRRIAGILDAADALRAKRRESIALLDTLPQLIFLEMFGNAESGWQQCAVEEVAADHRGSIRTGPFGSQLLHSEFVDAGVAVLGIDNAVSNEFQWGERRFITEDKYNELRRYRVHPGDVLITIMGTTGRCAIVPEDIPLAINTKHLCCITLDKQKCLPEYLHAYFLHHRDAREYLGRQGKGAIMVGLNMSLIRAMPLTVPPIDLQAEFVHRVSAAREARETAGQAADESDALFTSLQERAFRGEM